MKTPEQLRQRREFVWGVVVWGILLFLMVGAALYSLLRKP